MENNKGVMIYAEEKNGVFHRVTFELLGVGRKLADKLGSTLSVAVLGPEDLNLSELYETGADLVVHVADNDRFSRPDEYMFSENLIKLISNQKPEVFLIGATSLGRSVAPRVAAALGTGLTADCTDLDIDEAGRLVQIRPAFSENILAHIATNTTPQMATVRYKEFPEGVKIPGRTGQVKKLSECGAENKSLLEILEIGSSSFDISDSQVVVSGGSGFRQPEDFKMLHQLADLLGGSVGSSRPMVESGFISKEHQVGYSGNRVKPKVYIACGISGAPQHLAGMLDSDTIVAINSDPSAPIFKVADYGIVGDIYKVVPALIERIRQERAANKN